MAKSRRDRAKAAIRKIRAAEKLSRTARSGQERVKAATQNIRAFHDLGRALPPKPERHKDNWGRRIIGGEADLLGVNEDTLRKARAFADPDKGYTRKKLDDLCRLIREVQPVRRKVKPDQEEELPIFQRSHVIRLLSVKGKKQRLALQRKCIKEGWSTGALDREIAKRYGARRAGGRRRKIPPDLTDLLVQLEGACEGWRRWKGELSREPEEVTEKHVLLANLPDELREQIEAVSKGIFTLHQAVVEELKQVQPGRDIRSALRADAADQKKQTAGPRRRKG